MTLSVNPNASTVGQVSFQKKVKTAQTLKNEQTPDSVSFRGAIPGSADEKIMESGKKLLSAMTDEAKEKFAELLTKFEPVVVEGKERASAIFNTVMDAVNTFIRPKDAAKTAEDAGKPGRIAKFFNGARNVLNFLAKPFKGIGKFLAGLFKKAEPKAAEETAKAEAKGAEVVATAAENVEQQAEAAVTKAEEATPKTE